MIPQAIHGNPVRLYTEIDPPRFPRGYPGDGDLDRTSVFVISVSDEGDAEDQRYWVSCVSETGRIMAGEMCYTLEAALDFPASEFDLSDLTWRELTPQQSN